MSSKSSMGSKNFKYWMEQVSRSTVNELALAPNQVAIGAIKKPGVTPTTTPTAATTATTPTATTTTAPATTAQSGQMGASVLSFKNPNDPLKAAISQAVKNKQITALGEEEVDEVLTKATSAGEIIKDFQQSKNPKFAGKSQEERKRMALGAYYSMHPELSKKDESVMENINPIMESYTLEDVLTRFPHEHKTCQEGWGMDERLYEALCDHYFKEGRIPHKVWHGPLEELRSCVEECYMADTKPVEEGVMGGALGAVGGAMLGGPMGALGGYAAGSKLGDDLSEEHSQFELDQDITNMEENMYEAKDKPKKWIQAAIKKPGALKKQLGVPADEKIPAGKLKAAAEKGGKLGQRARLAKTLSKFEEGAHSQDAMKLNPDFAATKKQGVLGKVGSAIGRAGKAALDKVAPGDEELLSRLEKSSGGRRPNASKKDVSEAIADPTGSWVVYTDKKFTKFKTHAGAKAYAEKNGGKVASSENYYDKIKKKDVAESRGFRGTDGARDREDDERHDLDPSDWYVVKDGKMYKVSVYPNQHDSARSQGYSPTREEAKAKAGSQGVAEGKLDELSPSTLGSYAKKANSARSYEPDDRKADNRGTGVMKSLDRIAGKKSGPLKGKAVTARWASATGAKDANKSREKFEKSVDKASGMAEGRMTKGPGGMPLDRQGNPKMAKPSMPKLSTMAKPKLDLDKIWFDVTQIIGNIFPDGDPADYLPSYCRKHGCTYDDIRAAAKKNGYKDEYDYIDDLKSGDYGYNEGVTEAKADPTGSWVVYNSTDTAKFKRFKTREGAKAYAEKNGGTVASSEHYHDKIQKKDVAEGEMNTSYMNKQNQDFYDKNPNFKRSDREKKFVGNQLASKVMPTNKPGQAAKKPMTPFKTLGEGKVKQLSMDLEELTDAAFLKKYKMTKAQCRKDMKNTNPAQKIKEATKEVSGGRVHTAEPGGYGRSADVEELTAADKKRLAAKKKATDGARGRGRPKKDDTVSGQSGPKFSDASKAFFGIPSKGYDTKKLPGKASVKHKIKDESKDAQMESWDKELKNLLNEGLTVSTSTGQQGMPDSVSVSATDADAQNLLQIIQRAGLTGGSSSMSSTVPGDQEGYSTVEPASSDEVMNTLEPEQDNGDEAFGFLKKMLGARQGTPMSSGYTKVAPEEEEEVEEGNAFSGAVAKAKADGIQPGEKVKVGGKEYPVKEEDDGSQAGVADEASEAERDSALATAYSADNNTNKDENVAVSEEDEEEDEDTDKLDEREDREDDEHGGGPTPAQNPDKGWKPAKKCNECGLMECGCSDEESVTESTKLDEWANSRVGGEEEQFQTEMEYMTKSISGGLNNMKRDQTTLPSTRVNTQKETADVNYSIAEMIRKLSNIN